MPTIIKFDNLTKRFGKHVVLDNINLEINAGEIFGMIGSSGSGKTTFLKTLIGFLTPEQGDLLFRMESIINNDDGNAPFRSIYKNMKEVKKVMGFAAQNPSFYDKLSVYENLDYFGCLYDLPKEARKTNIITLLRLMELEDSKDLKAENLSGGMQRRLDIACALMHDPKILLLDEPTADLDPVLADHIWQLIRKINKKGTTVVIVSHHLADIEGTCRRIGILSKGKIKYIGTLQELIGRLSKGHDLHIETYPGNYEKIMDSFKEKKIMKMENRGHELVIHTSKPGEILHDLLHHLGKLDESLMSLKVSKLSLDDVFISLAK